MVRVRKLSESSFSWVVWYRKKWTGIWFTQFPNPSPWKFNKLSQKPWTRRWIACFIPRELCNHLSIPREKWFWWSPWAVIFDNNLYLWYENQVFNSSWTVTFFHVIFNFSTVRLKQTSSLDDSSDDNDSELDNDVAEPQLLNKELGFLFTAPRTRSQCS